MRDPQWEERSGTPGAIIYDGDTNIRFNVTPDTTGKAIQFESVIMPSGVDGVVPPKIERRHTDAIKHYVKWKTFEHPENFNADMALYFKNEFLRARGELKREVMLDGIDMEVRPRSFVTGKSQASFGVSVD
ncbi:MAG: hypothetical protein GY718_14550 [Lentisphaerae bacterium]|nr:hypothetical protein [Lentisphaerota bacterium]